MPQDVTAAYLQKKNAQDNQPINLYAIEDYDSARSSSTATSTSSDHLVDSAASFSSSDLGKTIHNTTDDTYAIIETINSTTDVTLSKDIMESGEAYDLDNNLYFAEYKSDVVFDDITYIRFPINRDSSSENSLGEIDAVRIRVANVSRAIQFYLENHDLSEKKIIIRQVWADELDDLDNVRIEVFYIDSYVATDVAVEFECSSKFDVQSVELPFGRFLRSICRWKEFKDINCGYTGGLTDCDRTLTACRERENQLRFGGFPSVPTQRTIVA